MCVPDESYSALTRGLIDDMLACLHERMELEPALAPKAKEFRQRAVDMGVIAPDRHYHVWKLVGASILSKYRFERRLRCASLDCDWGEKQVVRASDKEILSRSPWDPTSPRPSPALSRP